MTHLQAGDRVVCVNAKPQSVRLANGELVKFDSGLTHGRVYTVDAVITLPAQYCLDGPACVVKLIEVVSPLGRQGFPDGYHPARFRKAISTGCSSTIEKLKRDLGVTEREGEPA